MSQVRMLRCFYCDVPLINAPSRIEYDHFPVPEEYGGLDVVPTCLPCHDLKDRTGQIEVYAAEMRRELIADFPKLNRYTRILIARFIVLDVISKFDTVLETLNVEIILGNLLRALARIQKSATKILKGNIDIALDTVVLDTLTKALNDMTRDIWRVYCFLENPIDISEMGLIDKYVLPGEC